MRNSPLEFLPAFNLEIREKAREEPTSIHELKDNKIFCTSIDHVCYILTALLASAAIH